MPECDDELLNSKNETLFCSNCGANIVNCENFCDECGASLNPSDVTNKGFMEKYKILIIIGIIIIIIAIFAAGVVSNMGNDAVDDVGNQTVEVGSTDFIIPGDFMIVPSTIDVDYKYSTLSYAKGWSNEFDSIYIYTMLVPYNVDAQDILASQGGVQKNMMGFEGYYTEGDGIYSFAFETGGYICIVSASSPYIFDEIYCLG